MQPPELKDSTTEQTQSTAKNKIWTFFFALMYPIITLFGLLFTGVVAVFSAISRVFVFILRLIKK